MHNKRKSIANKKKQNKNQNRTQHQENISGNMRKVQFLDDDEVRGKCSQLCIAR